MTALRSKHRRKAPSQLKRLHRSSDVAALMRLPPHLLRLTLDGARDIYHEGKALDPEPFVQTERHRMVEEILRLRAQYMRLSPARRAALQVRTTGLVEVPPIGEVSLDAS